LPITTGPAPPMLPRKKTSSLNPAFSGSLTN
jgi:hypothetical protein